MVIEYQHVSLRHYALIKRNINIGYDELSPTIASVLSNSWRRTEGHPLHGADHELLYSACNAAIQNNHGSHGSMNTGVGCDCNLTGTWERAALVCSTIIITLVNTTIHYSVFSVFTLYRRVLCQHIEHSNNKTEMSQASFLPLTSNSGKRVEVSRGANVRLDWSN